VFITFEGLDGAGKSTQIERLRIRFQELGESVVLTREPGGTPLGDQFRSILLDPAQKGMSPKTEALLYAASRAQLVHEVIRPALDRGDVVVCDRYVDASIAYQGAGLALGTDEITAINAFATDQLQPDVTFLLDVTVDISQSRVYSSREGAGPDRIEQRDRDYFTRVRKAFLALAGHAPSRMVVLDAMQDAESLEQEIWVHIEKRLRNFENK
jgi:dTMP kinase